MVCGRCTPVRLYVRFSRSAAGPIPHISVSGPLSWEGGGEGETCVVAVGKLCLAGRGSTQVFTFFEQLLACSSVDRTVDAASAEE